MKITRLVGLYESNVYILEKGDECLIVDAGVKVENIKKVIQNKKVVGILLTHGHFDHCFYANDYARIFNCKIFAHENAKLTMSDPIAFCGDNEQIVTDFSNFEFFKKEKILKLGNFNVQIFILPGHCHCQCGYLIENDLFCGDFLFEKSFGRIDLKFSSKKDMISSLKRSKDICYNTLYSGHGISSDKATQLAHLDLFLKFLNRNHV